MKSIYGGSAIVAIALLSSFLFLSATPSTAETSQFTDTPDSAHKESQPKQALLAAKEAVPVVEPSTVNGTVREVADESELNLSPLVSYVATAYSLRGKTASGRYVSKGIIAADPRVLPLGSRVRVEAGQWSGEYLVADTGGRIKGRKIDIWTPSSREAMRFGRRTVKLTVLSYGGKRRARGKRVQI